MFILKNIKKVPLEIATILAQDVLIKKLLIIDNADALSEEAPDKDLNDLLKEHYISMEPPVENRIEQYDRNTFVSILVDSVTNNTDENVRANITIYVSTNMDHLMLTNNKNRLLELTDRIGQLLQDRKLSASGKVSISSMSHVMLSEFHSAYRMTFAVVDQQKKDGDI